MGLVDEASGKRRLLGSDRIRLLGELRGKLRIGIEGSLDAAGDCPAGSAELNPASERRREPGPKDERQAVGLGQEWRHGADRPGDGTARWVGVVLGRGVEGVLCGGELILDDHELGSPAGGKIGRGRRIVQGFTQGLLSSGQDIAQPAKVLASRLDLVTHRSLVNAAPGYPDRRPEHGESDGQSDRLHHTAGLVSPTPLQPTEG